MRKQIEGNIQMTTSAAENLAGRAGDKEKVEKRRALGRGLASLLPGPRVVTGGTGGPADKQQIPHSVRNDKDSVRNDKTASGGNPIRGEAVPGTIRAVVEGTMEEESRAGVPAPHVPAPHVPVPYAAASETELRSAEQPGAAVPIFNAPAMAAVSTFSAADAAEPTSTTAARDETITIYAQAESRMPANLVVNLAIADIDKNPFQTRYVEDDEKLEELSDSIKANGVVQPIMVRPSDEDDGRYVLILGERRLHASKKAGKTHIPAMVRRVSLQQAAEMTIVENLQREDLSALEQAEAFRVLSTRFSLTQQQIGERVGLSRASVTNYMRLLKLPRDVMQLLAEKKINFAQAKELLKLNGDDKIAEAAIYAVKKGLTLEQVEMLVLRMNGLLDPIPGMPGQEPRKSSGARWVDPNVRAAQLDLERMLGVRVRIRDRKGKGKIVIEYSTVDDYDRVVEMLRGRKASSS
ncbi:MAG TPA: ParB/RepB/Spo0J family partition protein [Candidatus Sulfotelmatobacter sp.]|nr:ParB/RepB/Spo0J family partition protein [Candidatus Sulfotelmatobacter sp.]